MTENPGAREHGEVRDEESERMLSSPTPLEALTREYPDLRKHLYTPEGTLLLL